jgi:hypothetical protein
VLIQRGGPCAPSKRNTPSAPKRADDDQSSLETDAVLASRHGSRGRPKARRLHASDDLDDHVRRGSEDLQHVLGPDLVTGQQDDQNMDKAWWPGADYRVGELGKGLEACPGCDVAAGASWLRTIRSPSYAAKVDPR